MTTTAKKDIRALSQVELEQQFEALGEKKFILTIIEGRNRQVRKMCEEVGLPVVRLLRTRIGAISLAGLKVGKYRELSPLEVEKLVARAKPRTNSRSKSQVKPGKRPSRA